MEEDLLKWLLDAPATNGHFADRVNGMLRPTAVTPSLTIQVIAANTDYVHDGRADLLYPRIQFDVWASTWAKAKKAARALATELERGSVQANTIFFEGIEVNNRDMPTETLDGGTKVFRVALEYLVPWKMKGV